MRLSAWATVSWLVSSSLAINFIIEFYVRLMGGPVIHSDTGQFELYPDWLVECHYAYFWFSAVLYLLMIYITPHLDRENPRAGIYWIVDKLLFAHIATVATLRLAGAPWQWVYPGSAVATVALPAAAAAAYYKRWQAHQESEAISPEAIRDIALEASAAQAFDERFEGAKAYIFDNAVKNQRATCLLLFRRDRPERPELMEDLILQIPVDIKAKRPINEVISGARYLFYETPDGVAAVHLPAPDLSAPESWDTPPDNFSLDKIDSAAPRHPSLQDAPLPIMVRKIEYTKLDQR